MSPEVAQLAGQFLQRVTLQPAEIDAYQAVMQALEAVIREQPQETTEDE